MTGLWFCGSYLAHAAGDARERSATQIRAAVDRGGALKRLVPDVVAEYIQKEGLYRKRGARGWGLGSGTRGQVVVVRDEGLL